MLWGPEPPALDRLPTLRTLHLKGGERGASRFDLQLIAKLPALRELSVTTPEYLVNVQLLSALTRLTVREPNPYYGEWPRQLPESLQELRLWSGGLKQESLLALLRPLAELRSLLVCSTKVDDTFTGKLLWLRLGKLTSLALLECSAITNSETLRALCWMEPPLRSLALVRTCSAALDNRRGVGLERLRELSRHGLRELLVDRERVTLCRQALSADDPCRVLAFNEDDALPN